VIPVIIPARMGSSRFPGKPLAMILGKAMIARVAELSAAAVGKKNVFVATDSSEISMLVEGLGFNVVLTSEFCKTGTDRVAEAMRLIGLQKAINVQGDEPLLDPVTIKLVSEHLSGSDHVVNLSAPLLPEEESSNLAIPKLVCSQSGRLLYASRRSIPGTKTLSTEDLPGIRKQVAVYGFNIENLQSFGPQGLKTPLEEIEDIEILRFLELDIPVYVAHTDAKSIAVDYPQDITRVEAYLSSV
jgi:3-deoxy-manno-octulosonate cytidylyltransferase (CMP-KDO synthetase)